MRMKPEKRTKQLLDAALEVAIEKGFENITTGNVAKCAGCTQPLILHYYPTREALRDAVMRAAVRRQIHQVIAQGIAYGHPVALNAPRRLQRESLLNILSN